MINKSDSVSNFPNLDAIRGLGVTIMFVAHIEALKKYSSIPNFFFVFSEWKLGYITLVVFFVLSGFLITYLLLKEKYSSSTISISRFYIRRAKRLWPVYYLVLFLVLFVLPFVSFFSLETDDSLSVLDLNDHVSVLLFFFHMPDIAFINQVYQFVGQFWSIGIEEKFYLIWPLVIRYSKNVFYSMLVLLFIVIAFKFGSYVLASRSPASEFLAFLNKYSFRFMLDSMIVGALAGYFLFVKHKILNIIYKQYTQVFAIISIAFLLLLSVFIDFTSYVLFAIPISVLILNMAENPDSLLRLNVPAMDYIGKISYGMYMYSIIVIVFFLVIASKLPFGKGTLVFNAFLYVGSYVITVLISSISYYSFERKIIDM